MANTSKRKNFRDIAIEEQFSKKEKEHGQFPPGKNRGINAESNNTFLMLKLVEKMKRLNLPKEEREQLIELHHTKDELMKIGNYRGAEQISAKISSILKWHESKKKGIVLLDK